MRQEMSKQFHAMQEQLNNLISSSTVAQNSSDLLAKENRGKSSDISNVNINQNQSEAMTMESTDIFQILPEHLNGYILSFLNIYDYLNVYNNAQGKIPLKFQYISWSRSNLIFSENNKLAVQSLDMEEDVQNNKTGNLKKLQDDFRTHESVLMKFMYGEDFSSGFSRYVNNKDSK
jgi:hypothetical protein